MNKSIYITLLFLLFAMQWFIPAQMIYQQEDTLDTGTTYKFKTAPIDPSDPFRGKYIILDYEINSFETNKEGWYDYRGKVFVYLKTDAEGFATVKYVSKTLLDTSDEYVIAESKYNYNDTKVYFDLPFDCFHMNENKAYDAEVSVRKAQIDTTKICYGLVFVKDGTAVLDNVFIDDTPIQKFVDEYQEEMKSLQENN